MRSPKRLVNEQTGEVYYRVRYRKDGKERALSLYGDTADADAAEFCALLNSLGADRAVAWWNAHLDPEESTALTVDAWFARYLRSTTNLTDGTTVTYERVYRRVWSPAIGAKPLAAVTREDIAVVVKEMSRTKADKTVKNHYGVIATCFKAAVAEGLLPTTPCRNIKMPRRTAHTKVEMRFLRFPEWERLRDQLPVHYVPLFTTMIGTGIRWGEAEALTVGDVWLDAVIELDDGAVEVVPQLQINKAAKWNASKSTRAIGPTKTSRSERTIALPPEVVEVLEPLVEGRKRTERLFLAPKGGPLRHRTVYDYWKKAAENAGLDPQPRIHDLRHTHVAWLIAGGIPLPVIQARLGHEQITTTIDRYGGLLPDLQAATARAASIAMKPRVTTPAPKEIEP